jgi:superfamily II DNA/RNA helicase
VDGFAIYKKEIREMIELGYISDYQIHIPIFNDDPDDKAVCKHLIQSYRNIIVYCSSQNEGKRINELMNQLMKGCSEYIDCDTNKKKRKDIIKKYKEGKIPFLVNVRILVEGFDAPITKGICFMHLPSNQTTIIQIIGRALRKHSDKTFANIILPFSKDEDENSISQFLKIMSLNDRRIKKSFHEKTLGGYISIENINENEENENEHELELKYNLIFNNMGECLNGVEVWELKLEKVKKYMDENDKRPSSNDMNKEIKQLGQWISNQLKNYKNKSGTIKREEIYEKWTEFINDPKYSKYFLSDEESWNEKLKEVKIYIDENNRRPVIDKKKSSVNLHRSQLGQWISNQLKNYKNNAKLMKCDRIYKKWTEFINDPKYSKYFLYGEELWNERLKEVLKYIDDNNRKPSRNDSEKTLGLWINTQLINYKTKTDVMSNEEIRKKWIEITKHPKYSKYLSSKNDLWILNLEEVKKYIDENNKRPVVDKKKNSVNLHRSQLGEWINTQVTNYKNKLNIMKEYDEIYEQWKLFINDPKYSKYFLTDEELWIFKLQEVKKYIDENNKRPSCSDLNKEIKASGIWITRQTGNYNKKRQIMSKEEFRLKLMEFVNDPKYSKYFK